MAEGQELGPKASYVYLGDNGNSYVILRDTELALTSLTGLLPYTEGMATLDSMPRRIKPRGVHWLAFSGGRFIRKFVICGTPDSTLFQVNGGGPLTIAGTAGFTTGRRGEAETFIRRTIAGTGP